MSISIDQLVEHRSIIVVNKITSDLYDLLGDLTSDTAVWGIDLSNPTPTEINNTSKNDIPVEYTLFMENTINNFIVKEHKQKSMFSGTVLKFQVWSNRLRKLFDLKSKVVTPIYLCDDVSGKTQMYFLNWLNQCGFLVILFSKQENFCVETYSYNTYDTSSEVCEFTSVSRLMQGYEVTRSIPSWFSEIKFDSHLMVEYAGVRDEDIYIEDLYNFIKTLKNSSVNYKLQEGSIKNAEPSEINSDLQSNISNDAMSLLPTLPLKYEESQAFQSVIKERNIVSKSVLTNLYCVYLRYRGLVGNGWLIVLTDKMSLVGYMVFDVLTKLGVSIIVFNPSKADLTLSSDFTVKSFDNSLSVSEFPKSSVTNSVKKLTTVASKAEVEIESEIYSSGLGIYKNKQFKSVDVVYLDTIFEEIAQLWSIEMKFRQGFDDTDVNNVVIPSLYAQVLGVPFDDYNNWISNLVNYDNTIFYNNQEYVEFYPRTIYLAQLGSIEGDKVQLNFDLVSSHKDYHYDFLNEDTQRYIVSKIQKVLNLNVLKGQYKSGVENTICQVLLNLPLDILNIIQNFDFTKHNPKFVYLNSTNNQMTLETTILTLFLSLVGFDVVFLIPTGYNILSKHVLKTYYKVYDFGNYDYAFSYSFASKGKSLLSRIFKRK